MNCIYTSVFLNQAGVRPLLRMAVMILILAIVNWPSVAQEGQRVSGKLTDEGGQAISDVTVSVKNRVGNTATTDAAGDVWRYEFDVRGYWPFQTPQ